jgi:hypothetical protein
MTCSEAADTRRRSGNNVKRSGEASPRFRGGKKHTIAWVTSNAILPLALLCTLAGRLQNAIKNHSMGPFDVQTQGKEISAIPLGLDGRDQGGAAPRPHYAEALRYTASSSEAPLDFLQPTISQINPTPWPPIVLFRSQRQFARPWLNPKASQGPPQRNKRRGSI